MERTFHGASHLGRCNIDDLLMAEALQVRRHIEIYLRAAENKMRSGLTQPTGDMWTRGWNEWKEYSDQIALLDSVGGVQ